MKPLARVVGWPARRAGGVAGELAGANAVRNPGRTASTAAALMIGLTLVTVVAVLGAGISAGTKSAITKQLHADYVIDGSGRPAVPGLRGRQARGDPRRHGGVARPLGRRDRAGQAAHDQRDRPRDDRALLHVQLDHRLRPHARAARRPTARSSRRRTPTDKHLKVGSDVSIKSPKGDELHGRRPRHLRPAGGATRCSPTSWSRRRRSTRRTASRRTASRSSTRSRLGGGDQGGGQGLRRRQVPHRRRVPEGRHQGHGHGPGDALRAAGLLGDREPVRHGQHDGALGVRAHP